MNSDTTSSASRHFRTDANDPQLYKVKSLLNLNAPGTPDETPPVFTFQRQREVEIDWKQIYQGMEGQSSVKAIQEYFEDAWNFPKRDQATDNDLSKLFFPKPESNWAIKEINYGGQDKTLAETQPTFKTVFQPVGNETKPVGESVQSGLVFRHYPSGRRYLVLTFPEKQLSIDELRDNIESYQSAWKNKIAGVEMVFDKKEDAENFCVQFSEIDLRPGIIARRYSELKIRLDLAKSVSDALPPIDSEKLRALLDAGKDVEEIARLQQKYARIKKDVTDVQREIERLVSIAENMGLILCTKDQTIKKPDNTEIKLEEGKIYRPYRHEISWTTTHTRQQLKWAFLFFYYKPVTVTQKHVAVVTDYALVDTSVDLLVRWREEYLAKNPQDEITVLQQAGKFFVAADGSPLRGIMDRCDLDESFRRRCTVLLPIFEESITGESVLTKYHVFKHPLPGISPVIMPRLTIEESLSYRTVWDGMVLGELANTINLAPGEQRTIHVRKAYKRETTVSRTAVSVFDVNRAESSDLATEMERIARHERERSTNLQTEASVSGGAFGVTASASMKAGVTTSAKEFGQAMAKVAKNAATSVTQQNREEVTTSSTMQTTVETSEETTAQIRNINEGRTLNLMFYRLYNRYKGGLYIEGLQFNLIPSVETIAGSGIFEAQTYSATELDKVLDRLQQNPLMLDLDNDGELLLRKTVLTELLKLVIYEYGDGDKETEQLVLEAGAGKETAQKPQRPRPSVNVLPMKGLNAAAILKSASESADTQRKKGTETVKHNLEDIQKKLDDLLRQTVPELNTSLEIEPVNLMVGSGGLYLDATVGRLPSTEPYSEEMRKREIRMRDAEIFATRSKGLLQQAQASEITGGVFLTSIHPDRANLNRLTLGLNTFVEPGVWQLHVDGEVKARVVEEDAVNMLGFTWSEQQDWLTMPDLKQRVELYNPESSRAIRFPVVESTAEVE
jgi:hypothetical protein